MALLHFTQFNPSGSLNITGSFSVAGQSVFYQTNSQMAALIVSGAMEIVRAQIAAQTVSASISIQGLGTLADTGSNATIDLGVDDF
tara:strand:- start:5268 stop:5525 length:258 start_codon:yes stop_codon:yes gene_type:complete